MSGQPFNACDRSTWPDTLTVPDMAAVWRVSVRTLFRLRRLGVIPDPMPDPGHPRWSKTAVVAWRDQPSMRRGCRRRAA